MRSDARKRLDGSIARLEGRDGLVADLQRLAEGWTQATCQTDGAPCSWHRVSADCADELRALLAAHLERA
jgi:hypothetical protein